MGGTVGGGSVGGGTVGGGSVGGGCVGGSVGRGVAVGGGGFRVGCGGCVGGMGVAVAVGCGRGVAVAVRLGVPVGVLVGVRVGVRVVVAVGDGKGDGEGDGMAVSVMTAGTMAVIVPPPGGVGVGLFFLPPLSIANPTASARMSSPLTAQIQTSKRRRGRASAGASDGVSISLLGAAPSAAFISLALFQRCERVNSIALITAASVRSLTSGTMSRNGINRSGSARRSTAVGGA